MSSAMISRNFKQCPLKKRPIVYEAEPDEVVCNNDQPQDLSLKRKSNDMLEDYAPAAKREYALNLSRPVTEVPSKYRPESPISEYSEPSAMLSPKVEGEDYHDYHHQQPMNIHLRGLTSATNGYTTNPYQSAFVIAAGCNPMTALWHTYQQSTPVDINAIYPSPATSIQSGASVYGYSYQQMTPPSSPGSENSAFEPEDLSVRSDIPLPALFHQFDKTANPSALSPTLSNHSAFERSSFKAVSSSTSAPNTSISSSSSSSTSTSSAATSPTASKHYRFKCEKCNKMYSTSMGLSKHQQFHCPAAVCNQEKQQHSCQECGKLYTTVGALKMHIRTHTLPCKCPICGKAFSRPWLLQGHIRTHTGEKPFQCPDCPRSFADRSNLRAHQQTHVDVKKYVCQVCNKSFSRMSLLNKHVNSNCTITIA